jgi:lipopolysaccharide biosynthesis regulator YciM
MAWQRAWELTPAAAQPLLAEALAAATEIGGADELHERMHASLRTAEDPTLVVALAQRAASRASPAAIEAAVTALQRVRHRSPVAALSLIRLLFAHGQQGRAQETAMMDFSPPTLVCRACAREMQRFRFRCDDCGAWDSAATIDGFHGREPRPGRGRDA